MRSGFTFNRHPKLEGIHAFLSASNYHWINYDLEKLDERLMTHMAAQRGTELHAFAHEAIRLGIKMPDTTATLNSYVNDALGFRMTPEQTVFYSPNCFGCADAISFRQGMLRIHDLKTGVTPAKHTQLYVYAAYFCLEYAIKPFEIETELRIYQNDEVFPEIADPDLITHIMDRAVTFDKHINARRLEGNA